jgi:endonuclease G
LVRIARLVIVISAICLPFSAQASACDQLFADQQLPILLNARLAQRTMALCNDAYATLASGLTRGPLWSAEHLTVDSLARAHNTARQGQFHEDERLPPDDRAILSDYTRSGYDRGHMTPSGDMPDPAAQQQSFSLANVVPQKAALNRNEWEGIESAVRHLAEHHGELFVVTGPLFNGSQLQSLKGRVLVPTSTWKAVYDPQAQGAAAYECTNVSHPKCITVSIAILERETGIDPFPALSASIKQTAMTLPAPEPSRYARSGRGRSQYHPHRHSLSAPLFQ